MEIFIIVLLVILAGVVLFCTFRSMAQKRQLQRENHDFLGKLSHVWQVHEEQKKVVELLERLDKKLENGGV